MPTLSMANQYKHQVQTREFIMQIVFSFFGDGISQNEPEKILYRHYQ